MTPAETFSRADHRALTASGLCIVGGFLTLTAIALSTVERLKYLVRADRKSLTAENLLQMLHAGDFLLIGLAGLFALGLLVLEWRWRGLSLLLSGAAPGPLAAAMAAMVLWFAHALLAPGLLVTGDAGTHVARVSHLAMAIRDGNSLYWDNYFFGGGTLLQFTGPVFHWIATAFTLILGTATMGVKAAAVAARFAAAGAMFVFLRRAGLGRTAAALGALFFVGAYFVTYMVSIRSTFPQIVVLAAIPAIFYGIECVLASPRIGRGWVVLCLAAIVLIGDHQPTAVMAAVLLALYVTARIGWDGWKLAPVAPLLLAAVVIALGSTFFLVPFALEQHWTAESALNQPLISLVRPTAGELLNYVGWDRGQTTGPVYTAYAGLSVIACAVVGAPLAMRRPRAPAARLWLIVMPLGVLSLFLAGLYVRPAVFTFSFLCIAAAASVDMLSAAFPGWRLPVLIFVIFLIDAAPSALQPFTRTDMLGIERAGEALAVRAADARVLQVTPGGGPLVSVGPDSTPLQYARVQMLLGPHKPDATKAHNAMVAALGLAGQDLAAHAALGVQTQQVLALFNVGWVVGEDGPRMGLPASYAGTTPDPVLGPYWRVPDATPVLASGQFELAQRPAAFDGRPLWTGDMTLPAGHADEAALLALVKRMGIDLVHRRAAAFLVTTRPEGPAWPAEGPAPQIRLTDYRVEPGRVLLSVVADRPGLLRLAHPIYPTETVTRNGQPVPIVGDVMSFIVLPIVAGTNEIVVSAHPSVLRRVCLGITCATVVGLLVMLVVGPGSRARR